MFQDRYFEEKYKMAVLWMNYDGENCYLEQQRRYEDVVPRSLENLIFFRNYINDGGIFFTHLTREGSQFTAYFVWLSKTGEVICVIPKCTLGEHVYETILLLGANENEAITMGHPSKTGRNGFDFLRVKNGLDSLEYISSLTTNSNNQRFGDLIHEHIYYDDGYLIFGGHSSEVFDSIENRQLIYYCFDAKELGINYITGTNDLTTKPVKDLLIYPNPSDSNIIIELPDGEEKVGQLYIYNNLGKLVTQENIEKQIQLSIDNYSNGIYHVLMMRNAKVIYRGNFSKE